MTLVILSMINNFKIPVSFKVNPQLLQQLKSYCQREHISQSQVIRSSLIHTFRQMNIQLSNNVFPTDDDEIGGSSW